jgi:hypothetical protein
MTNKRGRDPVPPWVWFFFGALAGAMIGGLFTALLSTEESAPTYLLITTPIACTIAGAFTSGYIRYLFEFTGQMLDPPHNEDRHDDNFDTDYFQSLQERIVLAKPEVGDLCRYRDEMAILEVRILAIRNMMQSDEPYTEYVLETIGVVVAPKRCRKGEKFTIGMVNSFNGGGLWQLLPLAPPTSPSET